MTLMTDISGSRGVVQHTIVVQSKIKIKAPMHLSLGGLKCAQSMHSFILLINNTQKLQGKNI